MVMGLGYPGAAAANERHPQVRIRWLAVNTPADRVDGERRRGVPSAADPFVAPEATPAADGSRGRGRAALG
jgi:hypothetical protein